MAVLRRKACIRARFALAASVLTRAATTADCCKDCCTMRPLTHLLAAAVAVALQPPRHHHRSTPRAALVSASDDVGNACALVGAALAGRSLGTRTKVGRALGGPGSAMALTFAASSVGALPPNARAVSGIRDAAVQLATPLLLLDADPRALLETSKPYVKAFAVAVVGTLCATAIGARFVLPALASALGRADAVGSIASLSAKNIGGGVNFCAVAATLRISAVAQSVALAADNVMALVYFPLCNWLAGDRDPSPDAASGESGDETAAVVDAGSLLAALVCVEIKFRAPHAIDAMLSPWPRRLDGVEAHEGPHRRWGPRSASSQWRRA